MDITWMPESLLDLQHIGEYISKDSAVSANDVQTIFYFVSKQLQTFPQSGRIGRVAGTFELVVPRLPYFIPYRIHQNKIEILRVYHTSRLLPERF